MCIRDRAALVLLLEQKFCCQAPSNTRQLQVHAGAPAVERCTVGALHQRADGSLSQQPITATQHQPRKNSNRNHGGKPEAKFRQGPNATGMLSSFAGSPARLVLAGSFGGVSESGNPTRELELELELGWFPLLQGWGLGADEQHSCWSCCFVHRFFSL